MTSIAQFAEAYTRRYNLHLVPLKTKSKLPIGDDWGKSALTDPTEARAYYENNPDHNLGVALGPSRLCSFDVDDLEATRLIFEEFGWNLDELIGAFPTVQGQPPGCRIMFHVPDGITLPYHSLTWPKKEGGKGRFTVWEIRSADDKQRQDVLPPSIHPDTGKPYVWLTKPNGHFPEPPEFLLQIWRNWDKLKPQFQAVCPWAEKPVAPVTRKLPAAVREGESVIEQFVAANDIETALERYGYKRSGNRWLSPHSTTMLPGVNVFPDGRAWIHHASDPLCSDESGQPVNVFDLFCCYEHNGDVSKAVRAAAEMLGIKSQRKQHPARETQVRREPPPNVDVETGEVINPVTAPIELAPGYQLEISAKTPMTTAQAFAAMLPNNQRIVFWRGEFFTWNGSSYVPHGEDHIKHLVYNFMAGCIEFQKSIPFAPKRSNVTDVIHALEAVCYINAPDTPYWIGGDRNIPASELIAFRNGFLHWPTDTMIQATSDLFTTSALDFDYDPDAPYPVEWFKFLESLWGNDMESVDALADMFGYLLTDDTSQQKAFMMIGPTRSGKGTILRVLEELIGKANKVSPSLASIGTQFGLQPLIGKRLAMISDARLSSKIDQAPIIENILRITGEDSLSIPRKFLSDWNGKLPTRFVFVSNELPSFSDSSTALSSRFIMFKFDKTFLGNEDVSLTARLLRELPSITLWALSGLKRMRERGYLMPPKRSAELIEDMRRITSPVNTFVSDMCVIAPGAMVPIDELFNAWKEWCDSEGREHYGTKNTFGRQLGAVFPQISRAQPREGESRFRAYSGIRLRSIYDSVRSTDENVRAKTTDVRSSIHNGDEKDSPF